jgi:hypothetical protein
MMVDSPNTLLLTADAKNRALRVFLTGLGIDVGVAVAVFITTVLADANGWGDLQWAVLGFTFVKTVLSSAGAFVLRRFVDQSSFPTPLPPAPVAAPADRTPEL